MATEYEDIFNLEQAVEDTNSRNAFQKVVDYSNSDHPDKRLAAVLCLAEALSIIEGNEEDSQKVLHTLHQFAEDPEVAIRRTLARQLNEITNNLQQKPGFRNFLSDYIFPAYLKLATDPDGEIRKGAHLNLLGFVRYQYLTKEEVDQFLVEVNEMTEQNRTDEIRTDAIGLLTNLAITLDVATTQSILAKFLDLCSDPAFSVRKACAVNFADMCATSISQTNLEKHLLPKFSGLCEDSVWGVRKACAESLIEISRHCSDSVRQNQLVPLLLGLLRDISRWVRSSAYQSLGPFIVTFAKFHTSAEGTDKQEKDNDDIFSHQLILGSDAALDVVSDNLSSEDMKSDDVKGLCHSEVTEETDLDAVFADFKDYNAKTGADTSEVIKCPVKESVIGDDDCQLSKGVRVNSVVSSTDVPATAADIASPISKSDTEGGTDSVSENDSVTSAQPKNSMPTSTDNDEPAGGSNSVSNTGENKLAGDEHSLLTIDRTGILSRDISNTATTEDASGSCIDTVTLDDTEVKAADVLSEKTGDIVAPEDSNNNDDAVIRQDAKIVCSENVDKISNLEMPEAITATGETVTDTDNGDRVTKASCDMSNVSGSMSNTIAPTGAPETPDDMIPEAGIDKTSTNGKDSEILATDKVDPNNRLQNRNAGNESENGAGELTKKQPNEHSELENANRQNNETAGIVAEILESSEQTTFNVVSEIPDKCNSSIEVIDCSSVDTLSPAKPSRDLRLIHPASVSVMSEPGEEMTKNIGSMNVEVTDELNIVDGLVQPAENLVKINITRQAIVTLQQDTLESEIPKTEDMIRRANVVHIPAETSPIPIRRPLLKKSPGIPRFGYPIPSGILSSIDDSHETSGAAELSSLEIANRTLSGNQSVVPCELLEQYLNMVEPSRSQTVDADILKHCAFSLPGVAKTLGQRNWVCLRQLYHHLARNMQWQVRRTLALSIHEMASILGSDLMTSDLLPVFDELIKDLDEVRSGIVKNLSHFLQLLPERVRICYLPKLDTFLVTETNTRWRYRQDFAQQLISLVALFRPNDVRLHILPLAFVLISDKVCEVRHTAVQLVSMILGMLSQKDNDSFNQVLEDLKKRLLCSTVWHQRQLFIFLSQSVYDSESIGFKDFLILFLPSLLTLCMDSIPNVRISLARFLSHVVITHSDFLTSHETVHQHELLDAFNALRKDKDSDVRYYVSPMSSRLLSIV